MTVVLLRVRRIMQILEYHFEYQYCIHLVQNKDMNITKLTYTNMGCMYAKQVYPSVHVN